MFYGPIRLGLEDDDLDLWYSAIEHMFIPANLKMSMLKSDIWSLGCIIGELFFLATPLFQCINSKDKIRKIIEVINYPFIKIIGLPKLQDVDYISTKDYNILCKMYSLNKENYRPFIYDLIDFEQSSLNNLLFEMILSCISYNPKKRPSTNELLKSVANLECLLDRKSNYNFNSANNSNITSFSETMNKDCKKKVSKDNHLESIRNRTRLNKFETTIESIINLIKMIILRKTVFL